MNRTILCKLITAAAHFFSLLPLAVLAFQYFNGQLAPNPAQTLEDRTGLIAISLLTATLMVSPVSRLLRQPLFQLARRPLGLYTFFYVVLHLIILVGYDFHFNLPLLVDTYAGTLFTWYGLAAGLILFTLALTSFDWWKRKLGAWWARLHLLIYPAAILALAHFFLALKGNILSPSGNLALPLLFSVAIGFLLILRVFLRRSPPSRSR